MSCACILHISEIHLYTSNESDMREKTGNPPGRPSKNSTKTKITFNPSEDALKIYNGWEKKGEMLDRAIIAYKPTDEK